MLSSTKKDVENLAQEMELDLVEISPKPDPPVCKIIDYKKYLYEQKKRDKDKLNKFDKSRIYQSELSTRLEI